MLLLLPNTASTADVTRPGSPASTLLPHIGTSLQRLLVIRPHPASTISSTASSTRSRFSSTVFLSTCCLWGAAQEQHAHQHM
jgi:hypothetical protein